MNVKNMYLESPVGVTGGNTANMPRQNVSTSAEIAKAFSSGKGTILDSGTTDTYFPADLMAKFTAAFSKASGGVTFSSGNVKLTTAQLAALPTIILTLEGLVNGTTVDIAMPYSSYIDSVGDGKRWLVGYREDFFAFNIFRLCVFLLNNFINDREVFISSLSN